MNLIEACRYFLRPTEVMLSRVQVEGVQHFQTAAAHGRGVLILTAHYGNWELLAAAHGADRAAAVHRDRARSTIRSSTTLAARFRRRSGAELIVKRQAVREVLSALRAASAWWASCSTRTPRAPRACSSPSSGSPASTSKGLARPRPPDGRPGGADLPAPATGRPALHGRERPAGRRPTASHRLHAHVQPGIEAAIRRAPEQWLWMHASMAHPAPRDGALVTGSRRPGRARPGWAAAEPGPRAGRGRGPSRTSWGPTSRPDAGQALGVVAARAYVEPTRPTAPPTPQPDVSVTLLPYSAALEAELDAVKAGLRDSARRLRPGGELGSRPRGWTTSGPCSRRAAARWCAAS